MKYSNKTKRTLLPLAAALVCLLAVGCGRESNPPLNDNTTYNWEWWQCNENYTRMCISWEAGEFFLYSIRNDVTDETNALHMQFHLSGDTLCIDSPPYQTSFKVSYPSEATMLWLLCGNRLPGTQNPNYLFNRINPTEF